MKKGIFLSYFIFTSLVFSALAISAQSIKGTVYNQNNEPIFGATVHFVNSYIGTVTNQQGEFALENTQGFELLMVKSLGYNGQLVSLQGATENLKVTLTAKSYQVDEFIVSATRANSSTPMAVQEVSKEELNKQNLGQDLPILLNYTTSMVTTSDAGAGVGYTGLRIRGSDATRINVTVNGIPLNDSESHGVFWVNMPDFASSASSVQIQRGVGTSTNGAGAFGASVNLQTQTLQTDPYAEVNLSAGSFNTYKTNVQFGTGKLKNGFAIDGRMSRIYSDGYIDRAFSDLKSYYLSAGYYGKSSTVKFIHFAGSEKTYQSWWGTPQSRVEGNVEAMQTHAAFNGLTDAQTQNLLNAGRTYNYYEYENETDNYRQNHYQLHYNQKLGARYRLNAALHLTTGAGYYEQFREDDDFSDYGLSPFVFGADTSFSADFIRQRWLDNIFYGGTYNLHYESAKWNAVFGGAINQYLGDHFGDIIWSSLAGSTQKDYQYYFGNSVKNDVNNYLKVNYNLGTKLVAFADLQVRNLSYKANGTDNDLKAYNVDANYTFLNPKAGITYFDSKNRAFASFAVGNREPLRSDFIDAPTGVIPQHETLYDTELGYSRMGKNFRIDANLYYMYYNNQLVVTGELNDVGANVRTNVESSYRAGLELAAIYKPIKKLELQGNLTLSQNRIATFNEVLYDYTNGFDVVVNTYNNTTIALSPSVIGMASIAYTPVKNLEVALLNKYVGKQYLDNTTNENRVINPYFVSDLRINYNLTLNKAVKAIQFNVLVNNVFNTMYLSNGYTYSYIFGDLITENFYYPQAGTNFLAGISVKF